MISGAKNLSILFCFVAILAVSNAALAQELAVENVVVATVGDNAVTLNEVHHFLDRTLKNLPEPANRNTRSQQTIELGVEHCIKRLVVLQYLRSGKFKVTEKAIDFDVDDLSDQLAKTDQKLDDYLADHKLTMKELRRELEWNGSWRKYARKYITEKHLRSQFEKDHVKYDGTQLKVAQILWKASDVSTLELANQVRAQLSDDELSWDDAVSQHSQAASAKDHGVLGWIAYSGPMMPEFNKVAFALKQGEFSKPFTSKFGTHIVHCIETKSGDKSFEDVVVGLRDSETNRLFELLAKKHSRKKKIVRRSASK